MLSLIIELRWLLLAAAAIGLGTGFAARRAGMSVKRQGPRTGARR
ncbi:MAG: hypothetical protein ACXU8U_04520 [Asticcacaulis sp.]